MIITCPNCTAQYDIDDNRFLPGGRSVRCSECSTSWFVPAPQTVEALMAESRIAPAHPASVSEAVSQSRTSSPSQSGHHDDGLFADHRQPPTQNEPEATVFNRRKSDMPGASTQSPRPKWGPMAERRQQANEPNHEFASTQNQAQQQCSLDQGSLGNHRRPTETFVDTHWEEVPQHTPFENEEGGERPRREATILSEMHDNNSKAEQSIRIQGINPGAQEHNPPGEVFAAVNVQPRELERALKRVRRKAEARDKNRLTPMRIVGWLGLFLVMGGLLYSGYRYRDDVVRILPGSAKVYETVGIEASPYGLVLQNISHRVALSTTGPIVEISGELHNQSNKPIAPPLLQAEAIDVHGKLLASWTFSPDDPSVSGKGAVSFTTRAPAPEGIVEVVLSFAPEKSRKREQ